MRKLAAGELQSDGEDVTDRHPTAAPSEAAEAMAAGMVARVRLMMIVAGVTTLVAIAAVISVIGYRVFRAGGSGAAPIAEGIIMLPKGARMIASTVADDRIVVTLDISGVTEIRTYDLKTFRQTGRLRFVTEP
jgi:hypothetical protein